MLRASYSLKLKNSLTCIGHYKTTPVKGPFTNPIMISSSRISIDD